MITVLTYCPLCEQFHEINVPAEGFHSWQRGEKTLQEALPDVNANVRQMLVDGICPDCWNKIFERQNEEIFRK